MPQESLPWLDSWLSPPRLSPYLVACNGNRRLAFQAYQRNAQLGASLLIPLGYFEIALRNAHSRNISERWKNEKHWLFADESPLVAPLFRAAADGRRDMNAINRQVISDAIRGSGGKADSDQVISNLSLGFWSNMTDRAHERNLWIPYLYHAWPKGSKRAEIHAKVLSVCRLRNRIAHHGKLFNLKNPADGPDVVSITLLSYSQVSLQTPQPSCSLVDSMNSLTHMSTRSFYQGTFPPNVRHGGTSWHILNPSPAPKIRRTCVLVQGSLFSRLK